MEYAMIDEIVNSIINAEAKADEIIKGAQAEAAEIVSTAEADAQQLLAEKEQELACRVEEITKSNAEELKQMRAKALADGEAEANAVRGGAKKQGEELSKEIARWILSGNC